jgi:hypothetical protein
MTGKRIQSFLPGKKLSDRILLGVLSLVLGVFASYLLVNAWQQSIVLTARNLVLLVVLLILLLASFVGIVWAIATPAWLGSVLRKLMPKDIKID